MNVRSFFGVFAFLGLVLGVLEFLLFYVYQAGIFEGYNGEAGIDWDNVWGTFGGIGSFFALFGGLIAMIVVGGIAGVLAHFGQRVLAAIFAVVVGVIGILIGVFTQWADIDWLGAWGFIWPILVWIAGTAAVTLGVIAIHERLRG